MAFDALNTVALSQAEKYGPAELCDIFLRHFELLGIDGSAFEGKKVVIKPNLVMKKEIGRAHV